MSVDEELKKYLSDKKIPYPEFKQLYDEYHSKPSEYKEIYYNAWFDNEERKKSYPQQQRIVVDKITLPFSLTSDFAVVSTMSETLSIFSILSM